MFVRTDVRQEPDVLRLMNEAVSAFRAIHVLINNAGVSRFKPLYDLSAGRVGKVEDIVRACFYLTDPSNDFVTGIHLVVDGGMTRKMIYEPET